MGGGSGGFVLVCRGGEIERGSFPTLGAQTIVDRVFGDELFGVEAAVVFPMFGAGIGVIGLDILLVVRVVFVVCFEQGCWFEFDPPDDLRGSLGIEWPVCEQHIGHAFVGVMFG